jgi:hypothetical protein
MEEKVFRVEGGLDYNFTGEVAASELLFGGFFLDGKLFGG